VSQPLLKHEFASLYLPHWRASFCSPMRAGNSEKLEEFEPRDVRRVVVESRVRVFFAGSATRRQAASF
jgi:hypothetical protein